MQSLRNDQYVPLVQIEPPNAVDNQEWRRIHKDHPTLASFGEDKTVRFRGWAFKRGEKKGMVGGFPWAKRFWVITEKFAVYFKSDGASEKSAGCIYIKSCGVQVLGEMEGHPNAIKIMPCVPRRPGDSLVGDAPHFVISVPDNAQYQQWFDFIQSKSKAYQTKLQLLGGDGVSDT